MDIIIRDIKKQDYEKVLEIYGYYVLTSPATFEETIPDIDEFSKRIDNILEKYPYLIAECNGEIAGFAYGSPLRTRSAYNHSAETTIYLHHNITSQGIGTKLYTHLIDILKKQNIINLYACITSSNTESINFHKKLGYNLAGTFSNCGYKLGAYHSVSWLEKVINEYGLKPREFIKYQDIK